VTEQDTPACSDSGQGYPGHWVGKFIWSRGEAHPFHFFLMARHRLNLEEEPSSATLHITAADRYLLYVNGTYLGRGPARSDPRWKSYDSYDVASNLHSGDNVIAVLAYHYGCQNNYTRDARAGLFAQLETCTPDGNEGVLGSDETWRVRPAQGWNRDVELVNSNVGVTEVYDANADPPDWIALGFDDSGWDHAYVIPDNSSPWSYLEPRQTPMMTEEEAFPIQVVEVGEVMELSRMASDTQVPERLAVEPHFPQKYTQIDAPEALLQADGQVAAFQSAPYRPGDGVDKGVRSPYLVVDFCRQVFGFPRVQMDGPGGAVVEMTYAPVLIGGRILPLAGGVRYGDRYVMRRGKQTWQTFEYKQFRYLQIVVRDADGPVSIDSISVVAYQYPVVRTGSFACSDSVLTGLWKAAVDTTLLQMEDTIVCDAFRERCAWGGDGAHGLYAIWAAFGDTAISDRHFRLLSRGRLPDGMLRQLYPGTDAPVDGVREPKQATAYVNPRNIPQHALVVAVMLTGDYYRYFGRCKLLKELYPTLRGLAEWGLKQSDDTGLLYNLPNWNWVDWGPTDMRGANFETNALYYHMLDNMRGIATDLGKHEEAEQWRAQAEKVKASLRKLHWNAEAGLYVDSVLEGAQSSTITEVANGMALLWGIATDEQRPAIMRGLTEPGRDLVEATPLFHYYLLEGLIKAGADQTALREMRERYAPMIETSDAPTVWEFWTPFIRERGANVDREFGHGELAGLAHTGGVGPAWTLSKHVLGVYPVGDGFQQCRIEPHPGHLEWARGVFPAVRGDIEVTWKREEKRFTLDVGLPDGLETKLTLARDASQDVQLIHNGASFEIPAGTESVPGLTLSEERVAVRVTGGRHHLEVVPQ
jgi:alpha-L-rhamnosidase